MLVPLLSKAKILSSLAKNVSLASSYCTNKPVGSSSSEANPSASSKMNTFRNLHKPDNFEKWILVWTGRYKSKEEIPESVSVESVKKAWNRMRIKVANYMIVATIVACCAMVYSGKKAAARGDSVAKMNEEWHKQMSSKPS